MKGLQASMENVVGRGERQYTKISIDNLSIPRRINPHPTTSIHKKKQPSILYILDSMLVMMLLLLVGLGGELIFSSGISPKDESFALFLVGILLVGCGVMYRKLFHKHREQTP